MKISTPFLSLFSILALTVSGYAAPKQKITLILNDKNQYNVANLNYSVNRDSNNSEENPKAASSKTSPTIYLSVNITSPVDKTLLKWLSDTSTLDGKFIIDNGSSKREVIFKKGIIGNFNESFSNSTTVDDESSGTYLDIRCEKLLVDGFLVSGSGK